MKSIVLQEVNCKEENIKPQSQPKSIYYIEIQKSENRRIKIPCSNEEVGKRILASYSNNKSNSKLSLM